MENKKEDIIEDKEEIEGKPRKFNFWVISTIVLAVLLVLTFMFGTKITGNAISSQEASSTVLTTVNKYFIQDGTTKLTGQVTEESGLYKVGIDYNNNAIFVYITKDGKSLILPNGIVNIEQLKATAETQQEENQQQETEYSKEDLEKLKQFSECLASKGVKIYGANWCGWTKKWVVETLGGFDVASAVYVECTENEEICSKEGISGYPTTKINGQVYQGERTIKAIAEATGCPAPKVEVLSSSNGGSC